MRFEKIRKHDKEDFPRIPTVQDLEISELYVSKKNWSQTKVRGNILCGGDFYQEFQQPGSPTQPSPNLWKYSTFDDVEKVILQLAKQSYEN